MLRTSLGAKHFNTRYKKQMGVALKNLLVTIRGSVYLYSETIKPKGDMKMPEEIIGTVSDFFARPVVAAIELKAPLEVGDKIHIKGHSTDVEVVVNSMQIDNVAVTEAKAGDSVGVKVSERVRKRDTVYKVTD
jgi:translation elongation factor EF-Tu-like GTPase